MRKPSNSLALMLNPALIMFINNAILKQENIHKQTKLYITSTAHLAYL